MTLVFFLLTLLSIPQLLIYSSGSRVHGHTLSLKAVLDLNTLGNINSQMKPIAACSKTLFNKFATRNGQNRKIRNFIRREGKRAGVRPDKKYQYARFNLVCSGEATLEKIMDFG